MHKDFRILLVALVLLGALSEASRSEDKAAASPQSPVLFDGKTLKNWEVTDFGGQGAVYVEDGKLMLGQGEPLTGIHWKGPEIPRMQYEISFEAQRVNGNDFFCALTFPVGKDPCSLVLGGWGGAVVGLSSINGFDASENETTGYYSFKSGKWYKVRVRVTKQNIEAWLEDEKIVDVDHAEQRISVRIEMELSRPLGLATFQTTAAYRNLKLKKIAPQQEQEAK